MSEQGDPTDWISTLGIELERDHENKRFASLLEQRLEEAEEAHVLWKEKSPRRKSFPVFEVKGHLLSARRFYYEQDNKIELPKSEVLRVKCGCKDCVNPEHMERMSRSKSASRNQLERRQKVNNRAAL